MQKPLEIKGQLAAAAAAGVSRRTVTAAVKAGRLAPIRIERQVAGPPMQIFDYADIAALWPNTAQRPLDQNPPPGNISTPPTTPPPPRRGIFGRRYQV